jgi:glycosyltransferase involved in cell wall biosynthesis
MLLPLREMEKHGYEVTWRKALNGSSALSDPLVDYDDADGHDLIVLQRTNSIDGCQGFRRWSTNPKLRLVYENDDDVFHITHDNYEAYGAYKAEGVQIGLRRHMRYAHLITVTTDYLGETFVEESGTSAPYVTLPNCIPAYVLDLPRDEKSRPRIGWIGSASHRRDIHTAAPSVRRFLDRFPGWDFFVSGVDFTRDFRTPADRTFHVPWIDIVSKPRLYYRAIDYDIGICPLLDTQFARCKSAIKALEYFSRGTPVVASDVLPYRNFIRHGETGFLCKYDHEWLKYLSLLAGDEDLRLKMGAAAKEEARKWTIENNWQLWADAYEGLF